nr:FUSC family protein [Pseudomonas mandelii]
MFSAKLFVAAMFAYALSVRMGLPQSYWSIVTCCVVMNPMTGAVLSKAIYRFVGTICAGICALAITGVFSHAPVLIIILAGLLSTCAFGWAILDRMPRAYGFQLYGVTLLLIVLVGIDHPEQMFDSAFARICEIGVGIFCCTVIDSIIAPRSMAPIIKGRLNGWLKDMSTWIDDVLHLHGSESKFIHDRRRTVADIISMSMMAAQLRYDPLIDHWQRQCIVAIQERLLRLMPLLSAIEIRLSALPPDKRAALSSQLTLHASAQGFGHVAADTISPSRISKLDHVSLSPWDRLISMGLVELVAKTADLWIEVKKIEAVLDDPKTARKSLKWRILEARELPLQPDFYMARRVAGGMLLAYIVLMMIWWLTGWGQGANAIVMGLVALAFFGGMDEAGHAIAAFARFTSLGLAVAAFLNYVLLPHAQDFVTFVLVMGLVMLPLGVWAASNPFAVLLLAIALSNINLQATYTPWDFGTFLDVCSGTLLGICIGYFCIGLVRHMGSARVARRLMQLEREDIIDLTRHATLQSRESYVSRALDRDASMFVRIPGSSQLEDPGGRLLVWMLVGDCVASIRYTSQWFGGEVRDASESLLAQIRNECEMNTPWRPSLKVLAKIDSALLAAWRVPYEKVSPLMEGLISLRLVLFVGAPEWRPTS